MFSSRKPGLLTAKQSREKMLQLHVAATVFITEEALNEPEYDALKSTRVCADEQVEGHREEKSMSATPRDARVIVNMSLQEYFYEAIHSTLSRQKIRAQPETASYLVNLLTSFLRTERLYEPGEDGLNFRPLALRYGDTLHGLIPETRARALRELGDAALFVAGVFAESFSCKLIGADYYAAMGGSAYAELAVSLRPSENWRPFGELFGELAAKFSDFANVLGEVAEHPEVHWHDDVLHLYERWMKTGNHRAAARLRELGIEPNSSIRHTRH
jgi:hypothetical protein